MMVRLALVFGLLLGLLPATAGLAQGSVATLSVLSGEVRRGPAGGQPEVAADGDDVGVGDRIVTGTDATALVTFLDGNTLTVQPESDITISRADVNTSGGSIVNIQINVGTVWARVSNLVDPAAGFTLDSNAAAATVRDAKQGGQLNPDGSFQCWTLGGEMSVVNKLTGLTTVLKEGETTLIRAEGVDPPRQFLVNQSTLRVTAPENVLPLLVMPDQPLLAGFVAPGVEVNQVFGSRTQRAEQGRLIEVPAGRPGPYRLVLEGLQEGAYSVLVTGLFEGQQVFQQELKGSLKSGDRVISEIGLTQDPSTSGYARTARVTGGTAGALAPLSGPLPGKLVLAPSEVQRIKP